MDAWRSPSGVVLNHAEDQLAQLLRRRPSPNRSPDSGDQPPIDAKAGPVPADNSFRSDDDDRLLPSRPQPTDGNPEELVKQIESRPRTTPSQVNCGRSTKFSKMRSRRLRNIRRSAPNASQSTPSIIRVITRVMASGRCYVIDFSAGQSFGEAQI